MPILSVSEIYQKLVINHDNYSSTWTLHSAQSKQLRVRNILQPKGVLKS